MCNAWPQVTLLGSYSLALDRTARQLADMEWDTQGHAPDVELSSNCLTGSKTSSVAPSSIKGTILYTGAHCVRTSRVGLFDIRLTCTPAKDCLTGCKVQLDLATSNNGTIVTTTCTP